MEPGVFAPHQLDELTAYFEANGYAILRGLVSDDDCDALLAECEGLQAALLRGELAPEHGTVTLTDDVASPVVHYVTNLTAVSPRAKAFTQHPLVGEVMQRLMGDEHHLVEDERSGIVYQDARPGRDSAYTRIGWHADWQSGPHLECWPSVAFTIHLDATSPANGFLRVVPGSHRWATPAPAADVYGRPAPVGPDVTRGYTDTPPPFPMPLGFEKIPGEVAVYCDRGDVILHDAYTWHSAARATDDDTVRRHIRGGFFANTSMAGRGMDDFVKNARR